MTKQTSTQDKVQSILDSAHEIMGDSPEDYPDQYRQMVYSLSVMLAGLYAQSQAQGNAVANGLVFDKIVGFPEEPGLYMYQPPNTFGLRMIDVSWSKSGTKELIDTYGVQQVEVRNYKGTWYKIRGQYHDIRTDA